MSWPRLFWGLLVFNVVAFIVVILVGPIDRDFTTVPPLAYMAMLGSLGILVAIVLMTIPLRGAADMSSTRVAFWSTLVLGVGVAEVSLVVVAGSGYMRRPPPPSGEVVGVELDKDGNPIVIVNLEDLKSSVRLIKSDSDGWGEMTLIYYGDGAGDPAEGEHSHSHSHGSAVKHTHTHTHTSAGNHVHAKSDWSYIGHQTVKINELKDDRERTIRERVNDPGHYVLEGAPVLPDNCEWVRVHVRLWTEKWLGVVSGKRQRTLRFQRDVRRPVYQVRFDDGPQEQGPIVSWQGTKLTLRIKELKRPSGWMITASSWVRVTHIRSGGGMRSDPIKTRLFFNADDTWSASIRRPEDVEQVSLTMMVEVASSAGYMTSHDNDESVSVP